MQDGSFGVQKGQFLGSCQLTEGIFTPPGTANSSPGRTPGQNQPSTNAFGLSAGTSYPGQLAMMNSSMFTSASSAPSVVDSVPSFSHVAFPPSLSLSGPNSNSFSSGVSSLRMAPTVTAAQMLDSREVNPFFATNPFPPRMDPFLALQQQAMQQQALQARLQNPQHPQLQQQRAEMAQMVAALRQQEEARMSSLVAQTQDPRTTANSIHTLMLQQQLQEQQQLQQFQQHQFSQMQKSVSRSPSDPSLSESSSQSFGFKNSLSSLSLTSLPGSAPLVQTGTTSPSLSAVSTRSASETPFDSQSDFTSQSATTTPAHPHYASPEVCAPLLGLSLGPSTPFLPSPSLPLSVDPTRCLEMSLASKAPLPPKSALFTTQSQSNTMSSMDAFSQFSLPFTSAYTVGTSAPLVGVSPPSQSPVNAKQALQLMISETSSSNDLKVDSSPHSSNSATNSARSSQAASSTKRRSVSASSDGVVDASYGAVRSVKQEQRRTPTTTNRKTPKGRKSTRAPENSFKSPILCGVLRPECKLSAEELSQQNAQSAELPIQHYREFSTLFNREVNVYTALRDPARRKLYQSSDLVRLLGVSNTYLAMHLSRRKKYRGAGIYQATVILQKQDSDKGIKTGGYFLSEEACLVFQSYWNNRGVMKLPASCSNVKKETK